MGNNKKWYQTGEFEDGYQFGDIFRTVRNALTDDKNTKGSTAKSNGSYEKADSYKKTINSTKKNPGKVVGTSPMTSGDRIQSTEDDYKWFKKGAFADGYQMWDGVKTVGSTIGDVATGIVTGVGKMVEGVVDIFPYAQSLMLKGHKFVSNVAGDALAKISGEDSDEIAETLYYLHPVVFKAAQKKV